MKLAEKADILDLDDLLDHSAKPKLAHKSIRKSEPRKSKKRKGLPPYIPPPMAPDITPDAVILYWRVTTCSCGAVYEAPPKGKSTVYKIKLPNRAGSMQKWEFLPKYLPDQYDDLPHIVETEHTTVNNCIKCHGKSTCPSTQTHLPLEPDSEYIFYNERLHPEQYNTPSLQVDLCPTFDPVSSRDSDRRFKQRLEEIIESASLPAQLDLGREIGEAVVENLTHYISLLPQGTKP